MSRRTLAAMTEQLELEASIGGYEALDQVADQVEATYAGMARLLGARREEIALFDNSTHAWNAAFYAIPFRPGDRILTSRAEYGSSVLAYLQVARRTGAELVVVPNDAHGAVDLAALAELVDERTKLIGLTWVPDVRRAGQPGRRGRPDRPRGRRALPRRRHPGGRPVPGRRDRGRRRLCSPAPRGSSCAARAAPASSTSAPRCWTGWTRPWSRSPRPAGTAGAGSAGAEGARRFETWERSGVNLAGFGAAVDQALELGLDAIGARAVGLGARLRAQLAALPTVTTHDQGTDRCAIVTATVDGLPAEDAKAALAAAGINATATVPEDDPLDTEERGLPALLRLSPHYYNTEAEIGYALEVVAAVAATV